MIEGQYTMKIKDRKEYSSKPKPTTFQSSDLVSNAIKAMSKNNYGCVVIVNNEDIVEGIVSERDLMIRLLDKNKDPKKTTLSEIMTKDVRCANENDEVIDWLRLMSNERFRHLPVVDSSGRLINLMSQGDFVSYTWPELITQ